MDSHVLVLNNTYEAINLCSIERAVILIFKGIAVLEEKGEAVLHSVHDIFPIPLVIRLVNYVSLPRRSVSLSKLHVLMRDHYTCQYCGEVKSRGELTIDHIIPKSKGGKTEWTNLVACCKKCNTAKGDKTLKQAGFKLVRKVSKPQRLSFLHFMCDRDLLLDEWKKYIFY